MKPQSAKAKGRSLQNDVRNQICEQMSISPIDVRSTPTSSSGCDIILSGAARQKFPWGVECKKVEKLNVWSAWDQATINARKESLNPLLVIKRNRSETLVVLKWDDFMELNKQRCRCPPTTPSS